MSEPEHIGSILPRVMNDINQRCDSTTDMQVGDKVSLAKYREKYKEDHPCDKHVPKDPCVITHIDDPDNMPPLMLPGCHVTDATGRLWFCYEFDEFEAI
ncbi:MAG: hypothetical protein ABIJ26_03580 [Candidatus Margulisiibacteriota bacterium]